MSTSRTIDVTVPGHIGRKFEAGLRHLIEGLPSDDFCTRYLKSEVFSKYLDPSLVSPEVRARAAVEKFLQAEDRNLVTNQRLLLAESLDYDFGWCDIHSLLAVIRSLIRRVLGPLTYPDVLMNSTHTNGASTRVRRGSSAACLKLTGEVHITDSAIKHWLAMASGSRLSRAPLKVVPSSVLFTVPKKTEIDRVACKEPEGNALLQRSVGSTIASRLRKVGINLRDQSNNRRLAQRGWADGLATIDLSSASDTVSMGVVQLLLPFDWWSLLSDLRCDSTILPDGRVLELNMFSSMGNGFTFELETLIFWAIAQAVKRLSRKAGVISVYGDDIIVPVTMARRLLRVLSFFGFIPNKKKTNVAGPFRESCGGHYWKGLDVSPFYVRKGVTELPEMINILNRLLEWDGRGWGFFVTKEIQSFWLRWRDYVPKYLWGGLSVDDNSALVTGHPPRKRLALVNKRRRVVEWSRLDTWLHRCDGREEVNEPHVVDPADGVAFKAIPVVSAGERSTWRPDLLDLSR